MSALDDASDLKPKQIKALAALAAGATDERAAEASGVSRPTIAKWRKLQPFRAALDEALRLQRDRVQALLGALAQDAERVVREAMTATKVEGTLVLTDHATRLRAAEAALGTYVRISQKAAESVAPPAGPLIILPPGTQRMALALDDGQGAGGAASPAGGAADVTGGNKPQALIEASATVLPTSPKITPGAAAEAPRAPGAPAASTAGSTFPRSQRRPLPPACQVSPIALTADPDEPDDAA